MLSSSSPPPFRRKEAISRRPVKFHGVVHRHHVAVLLRIPWTPAAYNQLPRTRRTVSLPTPRFVEFRFTVSWAASKAARNEIPARWCRLKPYTTHFTEMKRDCFWASINSLPQCRLLTRSRSKHRLCGLCSAQKFVARAITLLVPPIIGTCIDLFDTSMA